MLLQVWNEELAVAAQNYSNRCILDFNSNRFFEAPSFGSVGQTLAASTEMTPNFTTIIEEQWFDQRLDYTFADNSCTDMCDAYTQVGLIFCIMNQCS